MSMTTEQREAIDYLKESVLIYKNTIPKISDAINTVLSLIKEQQEEIENLKNKEVLIKRYFQKCDLIKQKDKQIDLMAEIFYKRFKAELLLEYGFESEEQLKQYFANKVNSKIQ